MIHYIDIGQGEDRRARPVSFDNALAYEYELTPSRNVRMNAPEGMHDDCVISLALATWGATGAGHYSAGAF